MVPEGWTTKRFADVADYRAGRTPARATPEYWMESDDGVPWISISDMSEFGVVSHSKEQIANVAFEKVFGGKSTPAGTLLMSFKLTIGRVATLGIDACHNEAIISIFPCEGVEQRYLGYFLAQVDYDALQDRQIKGNTLNRDKLDRIRVSLPPLEEQSSIADVLDLIRRSIGLQDRVLVTVQALKRAAMHTLFTRGLRGEAQKETEVGPVPESWEVVRIEEHAKAISKGSSPKWQGFDYVDNGVLFIRSQNVGNGVMEWQDKTYLPAEWNEKEKRSVLQAGDLLVNLVGASIGRSAVGGHEIDGANCNQAVCFVRLDQKDVIPGFLNGFLLTDWGQVQIHSNKKDIARANLSLQDVRNVSMPKPTVEEQREIVAILDTIDRKIDLHQRKRAVLEELFKALLHKLMTGEIRAGELCRGEKPDGATTDTVQPEPIGELV